MNPQMEDFLQLIKLIDLQRPLNRLGGWAASADFIKIIFKELFKMVEKKEKFIVLECGSGVSTIMIGLFLKKYAPQAKLYTLDHDFTYFQKSLEEIQLHDLQNIQLYYAPLQPYKINNKIWLWYDMKYLEEVESIDLLVVDGPPMAIQDLSRYPAIPLLKSKLSSDIVVLLDDAARDDEKKIVEKWKKELCFTHEYVESEKGTSILRQLSLKQKPLITIAIPTYNRLNYLKEALYSALEQTYENIEILVCDDGSDIDVEYELKSFFSDPRVKFFKNKTNMGRPYTRNRLIEEAAGEYILWLDDDDQLMSDCVMEYVATLNYLDQQPDVVYGNLEVFGTTRSQLYPLEFYENARLLGYYLFSKAGSPIPNPSTMVKKSLYEKFGGYDEECIRAQDYEFWCRVWEKAVFKKVDKYIARYRTHDGNVSGFGILHADRSYESYAVRKNLRKNVFEYAFANIDQNFVFISLVNLLQTYLDHTNAFFYLMNYCQDYDLAKKLVLQIGDETLIDWFDEQIAPIEKRKEMKKLLKLLHRNALDSQMLEKIYDRFGHSWIFHFASAKHYINTDRDTAYLHARASLLINPFSVESKELMDVFGKSTEAEKIIQRLVKELNSYERNKNEFFREVFGV